MNPYDQILYPGYTHPQTHPDRLATIGALFGMKCVAVDRCRVLELGCGNGSNLVPMAWGLPESTFLGIDLAARPVASGQEMIAGLGLENVRMIQGDVLNVDAQLGEFDYIIAHGLFSWVPAGVRNHLLAACRACLAPQGIAFVSYSAYPGCHLRNMLREMMLFHVRGFDSPHQRIQQAMALARFLAEGDEARDEYRQWMKAELQRILEHQEGHLYHDELAELSHPLYFTEFAAQAGHQGLQYLGEADFFEMSDSVFTPAVQQTLRQLAGTRVLREQYLDFLKCRRFRQTLLCRREVTLAAEPLLEAVPQFFVSAGVTCRSVPADIRPGASVVFETPKGAKAETDFPLGKAALLVLGEAGPVGLSFENLLDRAKLLSRPVEKPPCDDATAREGLASFLLQLYSAGVVNFRTCAPPGIRDVSVRPVASPVARWQIQHGNWVTSVFHIAVQVEDEIGRQLLLLLDGTHDRTALTERLLQFLKSKNALTTLDGTESAVRRTLEAELENNLAKLARLGLLIA